MGVAWTRVVDATSSRCFYRRSGSSPLRSFGSSSEPHHPHRSRLLSTGTIPARVVDVRPGVVVVTPGVPDLLLDVVEVSVSTTVG